MRRLNSNSIILLLIFVKLSLSERICERQGTCKRCDVRGRYSYYTCSSDTDCFREEACREGFCCPRVDTTEPESPAKSSSAFADDDISSPTCPDGSAWLRLCKSDHDCIFDDEICASGKCCSSCVARRRQILREYAPEALIGAHVPTCSDDGRFYQLKQCVHGYIKECFCVSLYGQRVIPTSIDSGDIVCAGNATGSDDQQQGFIPSTPPLPQNSMPQQNLDHYLTLRRGEMTSSRSNPQSCTDPNKDYRPCMSACQVACDTRTRPLCPNAGRCRPGCQCKLPYILETSVDDDARCVLPADCPLPTPAKVYYRPPVYPFTPGENTDFPRGAVGIGIDRARLMHCSDPLKNFHTCGSACPAACGRLTPACSVQCVSGCFCRTPYVLSDVNNSNSACILRQHCPIPRTTTVAPTTQKVDNTDLSAFEPTTVVPPEVTPDFIPETESEESEATTVTTDVSTMPPVKCIDENKEFLSCATSCPLACDNIDAEVCSPCVSGCFCKNGYVFKSVINWQNGSCIPLTECPNHEATTTPPPPKRDTESIGARLSISNSDTTIGRFVFATAVDQKIEFRADVTYLPKTVEQRTFVVVIHKYGSADASCEQIGDVLEINPVYAYPYPNGTLLYLEDVALPYHATYTFSATSDFAERSVGAVIGRSLALHPLHSPGVIGKALGCATIGILRD
uniref:Thyroglobulin type-1 domain-containing protein n=1 Tax=Panagrellus redivivus TaxID=6233 RepID=A0A7E4VIP2_PANRE